MLGFQTRMGSLYRFLSAARIFIAVSTLVFGVQHLVYGQMVTRLIPKLPVWIPQPSLWAYSAGIALVAAAAVMLFRRDGLRPVATAVGLLCLLSFVVLYVPMLLQTTILSGVWTAAGKALAFAATCFLLAHTQTEWKGGGVLSRMLPPISLCRLLFGAFLLIGGIQHFMYPTFVATLVPAWIPGSLFWTYFAGVALIAAGVGVNLPFTARLAGLLSAAMIFAWVVILHIPRALAALQESNETTAVFEALAFSAGAFLIALTARRE
jgi:uncharacterized membrane protein